MNAGITRVLLLCGVAAGPFYLLVGYTQAFTRPGFDPAHDDLSLLANGALGGIQVANFLITGVLVVLCAIGMGRALESGPGRRSAPILVGIYGLGLIGAGIFRADPMNGFPPGTPEGHPAAPGLSGLLHLAFGGVGFLAVIAACVVLAVRFLREGQQVTGVLSIVTGAVFLLAFAGITSGSSAAPIVLGFTAGVILVWIWLAVVALRLARSVARPAGRSVPTAPR